MNHMQTFTYKGYELHTWGNFWFVTRPGVTMMDTQNVLDWGNARDGQPERDARAVIDALNFIDEYDGEVAHNA